MNINWQEIKEKYPLSYKEFVVYICGKDYYGKENFYNDEFCICYLEKFFDEQGIIILYKHRIGHFQIEIRNKNISLEWCSPLTKTRDEAKEQAVYKLFEILENKLSSLSGK